MFQDEYSYSSDFLSSLRSMSKILRDNVIEQAASMLLQHLQTKKIFQSSTQNCNTNAFDEHSMFRLNRQFQRTDKCHSWLASRSMTFSGNALSSPTNQENQLHFQPIFLIHKKRLRRDYFLSNMQNCLQPPYSPNHFYAFDQVNLLKLQRSLCSNDYPSIERNAAELKRKSPGEEIDCNCDEILADQRSPKKKPFSSPFDDSLPKTADHISLNKYPHVSPPAFTMEPNTDNDKTDPSTQPSSQIILTRLEKILNLCGELRSLAKDVEEHVHSVATNEDSKTEKIISPPHNETNQSESEQTIIDIYKELEMQQTINDIDEKHIAPPPYTHNDDISSIHSDSHPLMPTESFNTKPPSVTTSHPTLRKPEELCRCFLKSVYHKDQSNSPESNQPLTLEEEEYLNELTRAYLLGREQALKERKVQREKPISGTSVDQQPKSDQASDSLNFDSTNNNNIPTDSSTINAEITGFLHKKHQTFLHEPIGMKTTHVLPGIGMKYAHQLAQCGFVRVRRLLGFYLMIKDDQQFLQWLTTKVKISVHSATLCTQALRTWCQEYL